MSGDLTGLCLYMSLIYHMKLDLEKVKSIDAYANNYIFNVNLIYGEINHSKTTFRFLTYRVFFICSSCNI